MEHKPNPQSEKLIFDVEQRPTLKQRRSLKSERPPEEKILLERIGRRLKAIRTDKGLTLAEVARKAGLGSHVTIIYVEKGTARITSLIAYAEKGLGVKLSQILYDLGH